MSMNLKDRESSGNTDGKGKKTESKVNRDGKGEQGA